MAKKTPKSPALPFPTKTVEGYKTITKATLAKICPAALTKEGLANGPEKEDLQTIWVITQKPVLKSKPQEELDAEGNYESEEWTETNEAELADYLAEDWDNVATTLSDGSRVVILCGTLDDEYGWFWHAKDREWSNYNY